MTAEIAPPRRNQRDLAPAPTVLQDRYRRATSNMVFFPDVFSSCWRTGNELRQHAGKSNSLVCGAFDRPFGGDRSGRGCMFAERTGE
jgi:hypothetical protein